MSPALSSRSITVDLPLPLGPDSTIRGPWLDFV
jgi:hypothetical protein